MEKLDEIKNAAKNLGEPASELVRVFEDLMKEYDSAKSVREKLAIARELSKIVDVILKKEKKEKSKNLEKMREMYEEISKNDP